VSLEFACEADGSVTASVIDDGSGMSKDELARAFEIGSRFDESKSGTGLGLAIARDLADAMGLSLEIGNGEKGLVATACYRAAPATP
jgi:signal transduction histidine kinase